jgi:PAS domain S-box-containing protein
MKKALRQFAGFLRKNYLKELATDELRIVISMDIPFMRLFSHLSEAEMLEITERGLQEFLESLENGTEIDRARANIQSWEYNETPGISREEIKVTDLIYLYTAQKQSLVNFLPRYTSQLDEALQIIRELEDYYSQVQALGFNSLIRIHHEELVESEKKFRVLAENATDIITRASLEGELLYVSPSSISITGFKPEELKGKRVQELIHPDDMGIIESAVQTVLVSEIISITYRIRHREGHEVWVESTGRIVKNEQGQPLEIYTTTRDITARRLAEEKLRSSERLLKETQHISKTGSWEWNFVTNELMWSEEHYNLYGFSSDVPITYSEAQKVAMPEEQGRPLQILKKAIEEKSPVEFYHRIIRHGSGDVRTLFVRAEPVIGENEKVLKLRGVSQDVTELKQTEEELKLKNELLLNAQRMAHIGHWQMDAQSDVLAWSEELYRIFGLEPGTTVTKEDFLRLLHPDTALEVRAAMEKGINTGESYDVYMKVMLSNGTHKIVHSKGSAILDGNGKPLTFRGTAQDVTAQKKAEDILRFRTIQLDKANRELEKSNTDLMQFASVASHDLKEPLRKIQTYGDLLRLRCATQMDETNAGYLSKITDASSRMQLLINDLLAFSRLSNTQKSFVPADLNVLVQEILHDIEIAIHEKQARFQVEKLPVVEAIPGQIRQLFQNLILNALKFSRPGVPPLICISASEEDDNLCSISVSDNGIGFEEKFVDRIFTIFQRLHTREEYEGTGIGLAVCRKVADNHSGSINARSIPGEGSSFVVTLPLRQGEKIRKEIPLEL